MISCHKYLVRPLPFITLLLLLCLPSLSASQENERSIHLNEAVQAGKALHTPTKIDLTTPAARAETVRRLKEKSQRAKETAEIVARERGWKIRGKTSKGVFYELIAVDESGPVYYYTRNVNAAISTGVDNIRNVIPYNLNGTGTLVGIWDGGSAQQNHVELADRVIIGDEAAPDSHATHVAGTIGAAGLDPDAMGMAPSVELYSCNATNDIAEMTEMAANSEGSDTTLYLSNHSYGPSCGWIWSDAAGQDALHWLGKWGETTDTNFGRYGVPAQNYDTLAYQARYYLPVIAIGNERPGNPPAAGDTFYYKEDGDWHPETYDPALHPPADSDAYNGYRTLCYDVTSKNALVVGAVADAVNGDVRLTANATMTSFSSWGPTVDGRIKPDVVGNGTRLWSSVYDDETPDANDKYSSSSGTSMAAPNVTGTAALLTEYYSQRFPGHSMQASTLKALLIHTADDLGNTGPDYQNGWGLVNAYRAINLIQALAEGSNGVQIIEGVRENTGIEPTSIPFTLSCTSPVRVTLVWTEPPGPNLLNDLDLRVIDSDGTTTYLPFILNPAIPSRNAGRGDNFRDNVEQVVIDSTWSTGTWEVQISHKGTLVDELSQPFSLIIETSIGNNDFFFSPQEVTENTGQLIDCSGSATLETDEPNHAGVSAGKSMWYRWTASDSGTMYLDTLGSWFNTTLAVYTGGDLASLIEVAANDDISLTDQHSAVSFAAETGTTYHIAVDGTGAVSSGKIMLNWDFIPYPANDNLADYDTLETGVPSAGTNRGATTEENEPLHAGSDKGHSVWWKWSSFSQEGWVTLDSTESDFDTALAVYYKSGLEFTVDNLSERASSDNPGKLTFYTGSSSSYYIAVGSGQNSGDTPEGNINLLLRPANDSLQDALVWEGYENKYNHGFLRGATEEPEDPLYQGQLLYNTIWWTWTAPAQSDMTLKSDTGAPVILGVYTKNELGQLIEVNSVLSGNSEILNFTAEQNTQYYILAAGHDEVNADTVTVRITLEQNLTNAFFDDAITLGGSSGQAATSSSSDDDWEGEPDEPLHGGLGNYKSVWWTWSPSEDMFVSFDTFGSNFNTVLAVYTGDSLTNLTGITSNNDYGETLQSRVTFCAEAGQLYYIVVTSPAHSSGQVILNWEEITEPKLLTLFKDGLGSVRVDGVNRVPLWANWYNACTQVSLEAVPDTFQHYHFVEWQGDATGSDVQTQVTMNTNKSITAVFAEDVLYTVTVVSGSGNGQIYVDGILFPLPWSGTVYEGKTVVLRPVPDPNTAFSQWSGDITSQDMPLVLLVTGNTSLTAEFAPRSADKIVTIEPSQDTTLYEDGAGATGNGNGDFFFAGQGGGAIRRGLIAFDVQNGLPADSVLTSASLQLVHSAAGAVESTDLFAARMLKSWGEGNSDAPGDELNGTQAEPDDTTWLHTFYTDEVWDNPGGDFDAGGGIRGALPLTGPNTYTWQMNDGSPMLDDLRSWQLDPDNNRGWGLVLEYESHPAKQFHSREHPDVSTRPKLQMTYYTARTKAPLVSIKQQVTSNPSPSLTGTVDDTLAAVTITLDGQTLIAANEGNGEWILDGGQINTLGPGTYSVEVEAIDSFGNRARDRTDNELTIVKTSYYYETCVKNYRELQRALALAERNSLNDRIMLQKGLYPVEQNTYYVTPSAFTYNSTEPFSLVIEGGYDANCLNQELNPGKTVIDGSTIDSALDFFADDLGGLHMLGVRNLTIRNGVNDDGGGATIQTNGVSISLENCIIKGNSALNGAGLNLKSSGSSIRLANCLLTENSAQKFGAGALLSVNNGEITLINNTVAGNFVAAGGLGGGLYVSLAGGSGYLDITNTIFWENIIGNDSKAATATLYLDNPFAVQAELHHNLLLSETVTGTITLESGTLWTENPLFADSASGDYHLLAGSGCIDTGLVTPGLPALDIDGDDRVINGTCGSDLLIDIGMDEAITNVDPDDPDCIGTELCYQDKDKDTYGSTNIITDNGDGICLVSDGESTANSDCDDTNVTTYPGAEELIADGIDQDCNGTELCYQDSDHDTFGSIQTVADDGNMVCTDSGESTNNTDCDDNQSGVYPGAAEVVADGIDQDCNGGEVCFQDSDNDTYGSSLIIEDNGNMVCSDSGESTMNTDCDDNRSGTHPGATEIVGDGTDQDCDGAEICYQDNDNDTYGSNVSIADNGNMTCFDTGESQVNTDCDDTSASIYPGKEEVIADGKDQDCNGAELCYQDSDNDTFGSNSTVADDGNMVCSDSGESNVNTDCNDNNAGIYPGATEIVADGLDQDCNGSEFCYQDNDGDTYGTSITVIDDGNFLCIDPNESNLSTDCNDLDSNINPGAAEICDSIDNNCDSQIDENKVCSQGFWLLILPTILNAEGASQQLP